MQSYTSQARLFKVLNHPARLAILDVLRDGEQCVCHLEAALGYRQAFISQHLTVLRQAGLVTDRRDGWNIFYRVERSQIYQVIDAMNAFNGLDSNAKQKSTQVQPTCPCPKCSPLGEPVRLAVENLISQGE